MEKGKEPKKIISIDLEDDDDDNENNGPPETEGTLDAEGDGDVENDANQSTTENPNVQSENAPSSTGTKKNKKITKAVKDILTSNSTKFMSNFDPELSNRERRKLTRKFIVDGKKNASNTDENGVLGGVEKDICDCLIEDCPGCHFPCPKCRSCKCGIECRVSRKWMYEVIENEADSVVIKNPILSSN